MQQKIQFKQQRELGEIITDTFKFIRLNWKSLFGMIFKIAGPALLILVLAYVFYIQSTVGQLNDDIYGSSAAYGLSMLGSLLLLLIAGIAFYTLLYGTVLHYIKSYIQNDGVAKKEEVVTGVKKDFWSILGISVMVGLITGLGLVLCLIPGIYLGTVLATTYAIHIFAKKDATTSVSYSFELIKGEWWMTFASLFVIFILYYIVIVIVQIPQYIYFFVKGFTVADTFSGDPADMFDWVYTLLSSIGMLIQYLLQTIIVIATAFIYFNLNEKKNFTGTLETIDSIGNRDESNA